MRFLTILFSAAVLAAGPACSENNETAKAAEWQNLIGDDLSNWTNPYTYGESKLVDGEIHLTAEKKFFLATKESFGDFVFEAEIHLPEGPANSGIMFRCHVEPNKVFGYQAECDGSDRKWSAGLFDEGRRGWIWPSIARLQPGAVFSIGTK